MNMTFAASMDQLHQMLQFIRVEVRAAGFEGLVETQVELALEEAIVNIIKHGYKQKAENIEIQCTRIPFIGIKVVLIDSGTPYNPLLNIQKLPPKSENEDSNFKIHVSNGMIGGLGVYLIYTIMNQIDYEHKEGRNILTLTKFLESKNKNLSSQS